MRSSGWLVGIAVIAIVAAIGILRPAGSTRAREDPDAGPSAAAPAPSADPRSVSLGPAARPEGGTQSAEQPGARRDLGPLGRLGLQGDPQRAAPERRLPEDLLVERGVDLVGDGLRAAAPKPVAESPSRPASSSSRGAGASDRPTPAQQHQAAVDAWRARTRAAASEAASAVDPAYEDAVIEIVEAYVDDITEARSALFAGELEADEYGRIVKDATVEARRSIEHTVGSREDAETVWKSVREANAPR